MLATASFDGHIGVYSLQATRDPEPAKPQFDETATADDIFGALGQDDQVEQSANVLSPSVRTWETCGYSTFMPVKEPKTCLPAGLKPSVWAEACLFMLLLFH